LGNGKRAIQELNELIEAWPAYSKTAYIVLAIAYRREEDLANALRIVSP